MTSAMQIVAERETPTRQWTSVAEPSDLLFPVELVSWDKGVRVEHRLTNKIEASLEFLHQRIYTIVLYSVDEKKVLWSPAIYLGLRPICGFSNAKNPPDTHGLQ